MATPLKHRLCFHFQRLCCALASLFPKVGVNLLLTWGIYTHLTICFAVLSGFLQYLVAILGTMVYSLAVLSYFSIVHYGGGSPLDIPEFVARDYDLDSDAADIEMGNRLNSNHPPPQVMNNVTAKENGQMRFCSKCMCWKPDRTHHCRSCKRCILKMDHHCPWFATCIGFKNHKFFVHFLLYSTAFCWICLFTSLWGVTQFLKDGAQTGAYLAVNWVLLLVLSGVMGLAVSVFTGYSVYLMVHNKTTLESMETVRYRTSVAPAQFRFRVAPSSHTLGNIFDLGWKRNFCEVMGNHVWEWIIPMVPENRGSGTWFPINEKLYRAAQLEAENEQQILDRQRAISGPGAAYRGGHTQFAQAQNLQRHSQSQFAQSQFAQSQFAQSQFAQSQFAQSQFAQSQYEQSQHGQHGQSQYTSEACDQELSAQDLGDTDQENVPLTAFIK